MSENVTSSKPWSASTKRLVLIGVALLFALAVARFSQALAPLIVAVIIAHLLNMPVKWIARRARRLPRKLIAFVIYIVFYLVLVLIPVALTPIFIQQIRRIDLDLVMINERLARPVLVFGLSIDPRDVATQATQALKETLSSIVPDAIGFLFGIAEGVVWVIFIFVVGLYLLLDADKVGDWFDSLMPADSRHEVTLLRREIGAIWDSFFVGQLILCTLVGAIVGGTMALLGIRIALILGLVAAVAELVPNIGHTVSAMVGFIVALLEGSSYLPVSNLMFAIIVVLVYVGIAQVDINFLIPRIIGRRMHLAPVVVIVGLIAGVSIGGVLGLLLAAPTLASLRVLGSYIYRRLLDLEPYVLVHARQPAPVAKTKE